MNNDTNLLPSPHHDPRLRLERRLDRQARELTQTLALLGISVRRDGEDLRLAGEASDFERLITAFERIDDDAIAGRGMHPTGAGQGHLFGSPGGEAVARPRTAA